jgi:IS30 family transposase
VGGKKAVIPDKVSIDLRPDIINQKERFRDWEINTVVGHENKAAILAATERTHRFPFDEKTAKRKESVHSITSDNETEFYGYKRIAKYLDANCFFTHPCSPLERGLNEYTNDLIRQYIPKTPNFKNLSDSDIKLFRSKINRRPGKLLNFESPKDSFYKKVALTT